MNIITKTKTLIKEHRKEIVIIVSGIGLIGLGVVVGRFIGINELNDEVKELTKINLIKHGGFAYNYKTNIRLGDIIKDLPDNNELNKFFSCDDMVNIACLVQKSDQ